MKSKDRDQQIGTQKSRERPTHVRRGINNKQTLTGVRITIGKSQIPKTTTTRTREKKINTTRAAQGLSSITGSQECACK